MTSSKVIGLFAGISSSVALYSFNSLQAKEMIDCHDCRMKRLPKAHELPLYDKNEDMCLEYDGKTKLPLISEISGVRQQLSGLASYLNVFKDQVVHVYETGIAHSQSSYDYLTSEENKTTRILAICSGGLLGLLLARKRGIFKKIIYTSTGTGLVFSAFYPSLAMDYASTGWEHTKTYTFDALEKYGGYDTQKLSNDYNEKVEAIKSTLKLEGVMDQLKEWFDKNKEKVATTWNMKTESKEK
ncbi:MICOS complex subunit MIC27 [Parasteatoda tepidariorum]|uniref:MICOS complex subunit MIC27 n=1 Tax=Parasteatoda tepidariorum TaxID=114398 RepID=UPI00077FABE4|nr:uncharacterized protein LOC107439019 [Parasteatoda tepidariorum]